MSQSFLNSTTHSVAWLHKRYLADEIVLRAPFQRNPVWTTKQKSYLIDTILRGYPIPELYMQEFTDAAGNDVYVVVDGQQRIRACEEFITGQFCLNGDDTPEWQDMFFDDLGEDEKKQIYNYSFVVRVLPEMPENELRSMFSRLNRNVVALNRQELRHATYWGEFIGCVEGLADDDRWANVAIFTPNDVRRMLDVEFISELAIAYLHGLQNKKESLDEWYESYEEEFEQRRDVEATFNAVLGELRASFPDIEQTRWRKKSDFYTLFLVLADAKERLPLPREARRDLRVKLIEFGDAVDAFLRDPEHNDQVPASAKRYAAAVERAATDLANRRDRQNEVTALLEPCFSEFV